MVVSNKVALPKYQEIRSFLMERLSSGAYQIGDRFYSENELGRKFSTTNLTVRQAMELMERDNFIERRRGSGTFVRKLPKRPSKLQVIDHCAIGILTGDIELANNLALGNIISSLHKCASENGYMLYLSHKHVKSLIDAKVEGVIAVGVFDDNTIKLLEDSHIPAVGIGSSVPCNFPTIATDFGQEGREVIQYFYQHGLNNIVVIGSGTEAERASGMLPAMQDEIAKFPQMKLRYFVNPPEGEYSRTGKLLKEKRPDVLFLLNGISVSPVLQALSDLNLKIPDDISILVHGENALALYPNIPLAIVHTDTTSGCQKIMVELFQIIKTGHIGNMRYDYKREIMNLGSIKKSAESASNK